MALTNTAAIADRRNITSSTTPTGMGSIGAGRIAQTQAAQQPAPPPAETPVVYNAPTYTPPPPIPTSADALNTPDYMAAEAALRNAQELFRADQEAAKNRYNVDYNNAVRSLGWIADPSGTGGKWDEGDLLTSQGVDTTSGRAFTNQLNDFANRGLLQSGLFTVQRNALQNDMAERLKAQEQSKARFTEDLTSKERNFMAEQEKARQDALNAAKQNLMAQYLAQYGGA